MAEVADDGLVHATVEVEAWLATFLEEAPGVSAIAGNRVFPVYLPNGDAPPAITYQRTATERVLVQRGASGLAKATFQVMCIGRYGRPGYKQALALARAVRLAVNGFAGNAQGQYLQKVELQDESDDDDPMLFADGSAGVFYRRVLTVGINYIEERKRLIQDASN